MSKSSADRNLLFGVLALELDFIDRDQLIQAMRGWVVDKSKSLGQLLVEQGELTANRLELLQALVAEHLKQHGGDMSASLMSLATTDGVVADLKDVEDDGLQATIDFISTPDKSGFIETKPTSKVAAALRSVDRFQIGKLHAAGGLGEVFEARDKELHRTVALKRIKERFAHHEKSRERFKLEAEITGRLEHPGVVPVYSLGQQDDGQPFYAMRFVEGSTLADAIKEHHKRKKTDDRRTAGHELLDLRRLLQRFIDVCQTIEYAHDRGVLHRDIKPSNVMLGRFGETLVVDWGLAKAAGRDVGHVRSDESTIHPAHGGGTTPTLSGSAIGTPPFMSPEQAAGRIDELTAASDVYSLGATLYTLLTGTTCVRGSNRKTAIERVKTGDFPRPRQVKPSIPPALEAICVKAMALEPDDRYASARDLADDVEHYLADEPVAAYRESWRERSGRWARRHRSWVQAGMAAMLAVTLVSAAAVVLINRAWHNERRARQAAVEHFRDARAAVDTWLTGASFVLKYYPAAQRARERLLDLAARDYERFAAEQSDYAELQLEAGRAQLRLGDVRRTVGDPGRAEKAYRGAVGVFQQLRGQTEDETACVVELANAHIRLGMVLAEAGRTDEAQTNYATAVSELETQLQSVADEPRCRQALATCLFNRAVLSFELGRNDEAMAGIQRAAEEFEDLLDSRPKDRDLLLGAARSRTALGQILGQTGNFRDAAEQLVEAVRCLDNLVRQYPDDAELLDARAATQIEIAGLRRTLGQYNRELAAYQQAIDDYRALQRALPGVPSFEENVALTQTDLAQLYLEQGRTGDVESVTREALGVFQTLAEEIPGVPRYVEERAACLDVLGRALSDSGRHDEARQALEQAVGAFGQLGRQFPGVPEYGVRLAAARGHLGELLHKLGEADAARESFEAAVDELQRQVGLAPEAVATRDLLAQVHVQFGDVLADADQPEEAGRSFRQAIDLWDALVAGGEPADYLDRYAWLLAMCPVAELRNADKSAERAARACQLAPDNPNYLRTFAAALLRQENWQAAEEKLVAARTLRGGPHGRDLFLLAMARWGQGDEIGARAYFNEAAAWTEEHQPDNLELKRLKREAAQMPGIRASA